jgi:hypothetical protein
LALQYGSKIVNYHTMARPGKGIHSQQIESAIARCEHKGFFDEIKANSTLEACLIGRHAASLEQVRRNVEKMGLLQDKWLGQWVLDRALAEATSTAEITAALACLNPLHLQWPEGGVRRVLAALHAGEKLTAQGLKDRFGITLTEAKRKARNCFDRKRGQATLELLRKIPRR